MIGVIGGMGPLATADFFQKVIAATPADGDADHVPLLIQSDPRIPPRPEAILHGGTSPLPALLQARDRLLAAGATALAMPCNTAHHWLEALREGCPVPMLSIVDAACDELSAVAGEGDAVGIIATRATLACGLYDSAVRQRGYRLQQPSDEEQRALVLPAIDRVKAGRIDAAAPLVEQAVAQLRQRGARAVLLACTEMPVALARGPSPHTAVCVDTVAALARRCVRWWSQNSAAAVPVPAVAAPSWKR